LGFQENGLSPRRRGGGAAHGSVAELRDVLWSEPFDEPIAVTDGRRLVTLRDAVKHLTDTIPRSEHDHPEVLNAATALVDAAEGRDLVMHARFAVIRALMRNDSPPPLLVSSKQTRWGKRQLKRDQ
jgi:hypothetical protein